jgi:hypothetical protein
MDLKSPIHPTHGFPMMSKRVQGSWDSAVKNLI